ncbi:alpha/beta hydrolase fold domain-containing protein [Carboxylicivirga caseinilyticus]|uniref:alpha/beta hydrolase fold domain-containing protein n=1 Tax=Carboxylicivirga caseinilyticus TaxID=3417572 RepID=UPI003D32AFB6|nr:alpha/beta hydrolase [Marinilabiliaceae bacterium A049]
MKKFRYINTIILFSIGLSLSAQNSFPVDSSYNIPREQRKFAKRYPYAFPAKDSLPKGVIEYRNQVYLSLENTPFGKRDLHLDIFKPEKEGKYPAVIMVHGGGWRSGTKDMQVPMAQMIAKEGFVTIPVEYQLSLEAKYPAAVHNIKAAIRWVRANAEKYDINPDKIAISGCSAGGHLAALIGMTNGLEHFEGKMGLLDYSSEVQAIMDIDGVLNFLAPSSLNLKRKPNSADISWFGGSFEEKPGIWKEASSIYWANENSVPILFLNSGYSRFHAGQDELIGMLNEWGVYQEVHKFNIKVHPFWLFHPWVDETVLYMVDFLNKVL